MAINFQFARKTDFTRILICQYVGARERLRLVDLASREDIRFYGTAPCLAVPVEAVRKRQNDRIER